MCLKYSTYQTDVFVYDPRNYVDLCVDYCMLDFVLACVEFCRKNVKCDSVTRLLPPFFLIHSRAFSNMALISQRYSYQKFEFDNSQ